MTEDEFRNLANRVGMRPELRDAMLEAFVKDGKVSLPSTPPAPAAPVPPSPLRHPKDSAPRSGKYFEVPLSGSERLLCSDNDCPCTDLQRLTPGLDGYLFISDEVVSARRDSLTWAECNAEAEKQAKAIGALVILTPGTVMPIYLCKTGARRRGIDLEVAAADAENWTKTGLVPLRASPLATPAPGSAAASKAAALGKKPWWRRW